MVRQAEGYKTELNSGNADVLFHSVYLLKWPSHSWWPSLFEMSAFRSFL